MKHLQLVVIAIALFFGFWAIDQIFFAPEHPKNEQLPDKITSASVYQSTSIVELKTIIPEPLIIPKTITITGAIYAGDSLDSSLRRCDISAKVRQEIISSFRNHLDFKRLDANDTYEITLQENGKLLGCSYEASPLEKFNMLITPDGPIVTKESISLQKKTVRLSGTISGSLFASFAKTNETARLVYTFADIFSSKIDFNTETRKGDKYIVVVDKYFDDDDEFVGYGKIQLAQYIRHNGMKYSAYYYAAEKNRGTYYDAKGQEVGTSFLRSPVPMARITSRFTYRRKHPITGKISPHLGVDLAAPIGTPIMAASDGKVIAIGRKGANGRQIILSHYGNYRTYYGHLSRYKRGLKSGDFVQKKEIIGYVGSSGRSTGPHLDYRIRHNGVFKNPFSLKFRPKSIITGKKLLAYQGSVVEPLNRLITSTIFDSVQHIISETEFTLHPDKKLILL